MLRRSFIALASAFSAAATLCGTAEAAPARREAAGSKQAELPVTGILVEKSKRQMHLVSGRKIVKTYQVNLGFNPVGHKRFKGDGKTPEGTYHITHRNPRSQFHLSLGVSYPSREDLAYARRKGKNPGGDIFIHGTGRGPGRARNDWTRGCIAVSDTEMDEIYRLVRPGTRITIRA